MSTILYPTSRPRYSFLQALLSLLIGLVIFGLSIVAFVVGTQLWYSGRIFPGVRVAGVDVGGLNQQQAAERITANVNYPLNGKILLRDGDKIWVTSPAKLGLYLDPVASSRNAYRVGRSGWGPDRLREQFYAWYSGHSLPPSVIFDQRQAYLYLDSIAEEVNSPTVEASLELSGTEVIVRPGQVGRFVDMSNSLMMVSLQLETMRDGVLDLPIIESAPVILDASKQAELARAILSQPLTLTMPEAEADQAGPWTIDQQTLASMLTFERVQTDEGAQYQVRLDSNTLRTYLNNIAPSLVRYPQNARFIFNDDTRQLEVLQASTTGRALNLEASVSEIQEKIYAGEHTVAITLSYQDPPVKDTMTGEELGIRELVIAETSYYYGSNASRVQNISTAASKFHGLMIAPGETFSMASALGDITLDNGYAEAMIILGGQTIKGVGGGVCQVSTTLFRAAFFGGYPIVERHAHAYRVYYYEKVSGNRVDTRLAGLDATVFVPIVDFKFTNDTPYWLLMETYVNPRSSAITWKFYSTSDGRRVDWTTTGPTNIVKAPEPQYRENPDLPNGTMKQVDWAADGADVTVNRSVYRGENLYLQDTIYTHYQPWRDVYEYGPGTEIPTRGAEPDSQE
jgi:vancomycin resistance protein YoaR